MKRASRSAPGKSAAPPSPAKETVSKKRKLEGKPATTQKPAPLKKKPASAPPSKPKQKAQIQKPTRVSSRLPKSVKESKKSNATTTTAKGSKTKSAPKRIIDKKLASALQKSKKSILNPKSKSSISKPKTKSPTLKTKKSDSLSKTAKSPKSGSVKKTENVPAKRKLAKSASKPESAPKPPKVARKPRVIKSIDDRIILPPPAVLRKFVVRKGTPEINSLPQLNSLVGSVMVFGNGDCGQLGLTDDVQERKKPYILSVLEDKGIVDIASGGLHNIAITNQGKLWSWGCNDQKALGRSGDEYVPMPVEGVDDLVFVKVACGDSISVALTNDGSVYTWGTYRSSEGIMGYSDETKIQDLPKKMAILSNVKICDIATGVDHVLALSTTGDVFCWGNGQQGQLGRKVIERRKKAGLHPEKLSLKRIVHIGSGAYHSFAITSKGELFSWGLNNFGQCGLNVASGGDEPVVEVPTEVGTLAGQNIVRVSGGEHHSLAMTSDGEIFAFGRSDSFQTGLPLETIEKFAQEREAILLEASKKSAKKNINATTTESEDSANTADSDAASSSGFKKMVPIPTRIPNVPKCQFFCCGSNHNLAITSSDNKLYSWGYGEMLQCGNGEEEDVTVPTLVTGQKIESRRIYSASAGGQHSVILTTLSEGAHIPSPQPSSSSVATTVSQEDNNTPAADINQETPATLNNVPLIADTTSSTLLIENGSGSSNNNSSDQTHAVSDTASSKPDIPSNNEAVLLGHETTYLPSAQSITSTATITATFSTAVPTDSKPSTAAPSASLPAPVTLPLPPVHYGSAGIISESLSLESNGSDAPSSLDFAYSEAASTVHEDDNDSSSGVVSQTKLVSNELDVTSSTVQQTETTNNY
ncbi:Protein pim1 [Smittium mucronatum]|uniref:Protein pim1 n=1 Tax=Smittium mucronatum TaxID=133383 RepID=A0A1R0H8M9_9FUNG|nr:Protein pim1 [Smittium mucronatum]